MISMQVFMFEVMIASTLTGLTTEAIKKMLAERGKTYYANTLAGIVSTAISFATGIGYMFMSDIVFNAQFIAHLVALVFISWLCSMVGYDKVVQTMSQFKIHEIESAGEDT